jgi:phosphomethylpyrimidine synthase
MAFPFMKTSLSTDSLGPDSTDSEEKNLRKSAQSVDKSSSLPNSKKIYVPGSLHTEIRVPFREISLAPTKTISGEIEVNEPVRVYDTSGPWGDETVALDVEQGLPPLRAEWIRSRGDVETVAGRAVTPQDDGWLSETHRNGSSKSQNPSSKNMPSTKSQTPARGSLAVWSLRLGVSLELGV